MVTSVVAYAETRTAFARLRRVGTNGTVHNDEQIAGADRVFAFEVK